VTITAGSACAVCWGTATIDHEHPDHVVAAATRRNEAIDAAVAVFAAARRAARPQSGPTYREAMLPHERTLDAARDRAWATFRRETET
jgi:hypothetical protein